MRVNSFPRHGKPGELAGMRVAVPGQFAQQAAIAAGIDEVQEIRPVAHLTPAAQHLQSWAGAMIMARIAIFPSPAWPDGHDDCSGR